MGGEGGKVLKNGAIVILLLLLPVTAGLSDLQGSLPLWHGHSLVGRSDWLISQALVASDWLQSGALIQSGTKGTV